MRPARARCMVTLALFVALGPACGDFDPPIPDRGPQPKPDFALPFRGPGRVVTVWEWGREAPFEQRALVLTERGASRELPVDSPWWIHWISPSELAVTSNPRGERPRRHQVLAVDLEGRVRSVLSTDPDVEALVPSPDGRVFAHTRYTEKGTGALEILRFDQGLSVLARTRTELYALRSPSWSPDGDALVASRIAPSPPEGGSLVRMYRVSRDLRDVTLLHDGPPGGAPERFGARPLWWGADGIYAAIGSGVSRCDPSGGGCAVVWSPPAGFVVGATPAGDGAALLLVADDDPLTSETRARELHRVDLATGRAERLSRTPDGVFLSDVAWTPAPES